MLEANTIFSKGSMPVLETLMHYTRARHKAIANNLAAADIPGYRTLDAPDAEFRKALARAFEDQRDSLTGAFQLAPRRGIRPTATGLEVRFEETADAGALKPNGNNVDLELEVGKMVQNGMLHNLAATILAHQFNQLREAIATRIIA